MGIYQQIKKKKCPNNAFGIVWAIEMAEVTVEVLDDNVLVNQKNKQKK